MLKESKLNMLKLTDSSLVSRACCVFYAFNIQYIIKINDGFILLKVTFLLMCFIHGSNLFVGVRWLCVANCVHVSKASNFHLGNQTISSIFLGQWFFKLGVFSRRSVIKIRQRFQWIITYTFISRRLRATQVTPHFTIVQKWIHPMSPFDNIIKTFIQTIADIFCIRIQNNLKVQSYYV
jgi:hypothetical protein